MLAEEIGNKEIEMKRNSRIRHTKQHAGLLHNGSAGDF